MSLRTLSVLVPVALVSLACGGVGGGGGAPDQGAGALEFASQPAPPPEPDENAVSDGLGGELGFPVGSGMVKVNDAKRVEVLHISAFDAGYQWEDYKERLVGNGWTWKQTSVPPFVGVFQKDRKRIELECELSGTSVWVKARVL
ncbi:MAG: hypothetical protein R3F61_22480 [Myxococcota bacterium]